MERVYERCCALDVHKAQVTPCVHVPDQQGKRAELCTEFSTMTADLLGLRDWLLGLGITHVAMEATGVFWKPVYYLLEDDFELLLVNAQHVKNVPGRKSDVKDAQWLCQLLEHGLLRSSFVPPKPIRELRDLTRYRKSLVWERARGGQPPAEGARGRQHQARLHRLTAIWTPRARRCSESCARATMTPSRSRTWPKGSCAQAAGPASGAAGALSRPPRASGEPSARPHRVPG